MRFLFFFIDLLGSLLQLSGISGWLKDKITEKRDREIQERLANIPMTKQERIDAADRGDL